MKDKYDIAIEYLTEHPDEIRDAWTCCGSWRLGRGGELFQYCNTSGESEPTFCGCLTQVAHGNYEAYTKELTDEIRNDARIPKSDAITVADLPVFAEWQRRLDKEIRGGIKEEV